MNDKVRIIFISQTGNTRHFVEQIIKLGEQNKIVIEAQEISEASELKEETEPFVIIVPTFLEGGTGDGPEVTEIFTDALGEYLDYANNRQFLLGVIGSGNKNFNVQYVLTAKRYAEKYQAPLLADYELRGTPQDFQRVLKILADAFS